MRLLRLAVETSRWELAAHVLILGAITARQKEHDQPPIKKGKRNSRKRPGQGQAQSVRQGTG